MCSLSTSVYFCGCIPSALLGPHHLITGIVEGSSKASWTIPQNHRQPPYSVPDCRSLILANVTPLLGGL